MAKQYTNTDIQDVKNFRDSMVGDLDQFDMANITDEFADVKVVAPAAVQPTGEKQKYKSMIEAIGEIAGGDVADKAIIPLDSEMQRLMALMSEKASICGFITPFGPKQELSVTKVKDVPNFKITIVERMSKKVLGTIIRYPQELQEAIRGASTEPPAIARSMEDPADAIENKFAGPLQYSVKIFDQEEAIKFIAKNCHFLISEAAEIYAPHRRKQAGRDGAPSTFVYYNTPADEQEAPHYRLDDKIDFFLSKYNEKAGDDKARAAYAKKLNDITLLRPLVSSYRGTNLATANNYIALNEYLTITPAKAPLSVDEAEAMNNAYIKPLFKNLRKLDKDGDKVDVYNNLTGEQKALIRPVDNNDRSKGYTSELFSTTGASQLEKFLDEKSKHWYGMKEEIKADEIALVAKTVSEAVSKDADGNVVTKEKIELSKAALGAEGNKLDLNGKHKNIFDATKGTLTVDAVTEFVKGIETKKTAGKGGKKTAREKFQATSGANMGAVLAALNNFVSTHA